MRPMQHTSRAADERRADRTRTRITTPPQHRERERASRSERRSPYLGLCDRDVVRELAQSR